MDVVPTLVRDSARGWSVRFDGTSCVVRSERAAWSWGLRLRAWGFEGRTEEVGTPACAETTGARSESRWSPGLSEWYVHDERGLEHGFTVSDRPVAEGADADSALVFELELLGDLVPHLGSDLRGVELRSASGTPIASYAGLTVFDATGNELPAWIDVADGTLRLLVLESGAVYPVTVDPVFTEAYIKASNPGLQDRFGSSVAASGNTLVVGAPSEDSSATGVNGVESDDSAQSAGAAYVFVRSGISWSQQAYLKASNAESGDSFGWSVAIDGDTIVVGAHLEDGGSSGVNGDQSDNSVLASGAAYVFVRSGSTWTQQAYLKASNPDELDLFGSSVAVDGDTIVVGAESEDSNATGIDGDGSNDSMNNAGAAYVFVRSGTTWTQQAYVKATNTDPADEFGKCVAVHGDRVLVGAPMEDGAASGVGGDQSDNTALFAGAAYAYRRSGSVWTPEAYLKASNPGSGNVFGQSVSIDGDTALVGAERGDGLVAQSGTAYVFRRSGTSWTQEALLEAGNADSGDDFGLAVALRGNIALVGARAERSAETGTNGTGLDNSTFGAGAAYVFARYGTTWVQDSYLKASNTGSNDSFGFAVAVTESFAVVTAPPEDSSSSGINGSQGDGLMDSGAAYVYRLDVPRFRSLCTGDGGDQMGCTNCPCGNNAPAGSPGGCGNSFVYATLEAHGDPSLSLPPGSTTDLGFGASFLPPSSFAVLTSGAALAPTNATNPCFGQGSGVQFFQFDGLRCAVQSTLRHGGRSADFLGAIFGPTGPNREWGGAAGPNAGIGVQAGFTPGQTRYFQIVYRDDPSLVCMRGLNTSQAVEVVFEP